MEQNPGQRPRKRGSGHAEIRKDHHPNAPTYGFRPCSGCFRRCPTANGNRRNNRFNEAAASIAAEIRMRWWCSCPCACFNEAAASIAAEIIINVAPYKPAVNGFNEAAASIAAEIAAAWQSRGCVLSRFNEAAASIAAEIFRRRARKRHGKRSFNEAAASIAAEIVVPSSSCRRTSFRLQ